MITGILLRNETTAGILHRDRESPGVTWSHLNTFRYSDSSNV